MRVSVIGGSAVPPDTAAVAADLGTALADRGHTVVCGGLGGVMEAVCRGARKAGGETIGILPTDDRADANPHVTVPIATGLGHARNALVVANGDAAVAVDGSGGTLSEIGLALAYGRPIRPRHARRRRGRGGRVARGRGGVRRGRRRRRTG